MADMTVVADALRDRIVPIVYPQGTGAASIAGADIRVYQGWPDPDSLRDDLRAGRVHVSVWPTDTAEVTTRYPMDEREVSRQTATLTVTVNGTAITFGGTVTAGQGLVLMIDGKPFARTCVAGDTLAAIAAAFAALIAPSRTASAAGAVLTVPNARVISPRAVVTGTSATEVRRERRLFQVCVWASRFDTRSTVAAAIDAGLADIRRMPLPDGATAMVLFAGSRQIDDEQPQGIYRRDLTYSAEYPVLATRTDSAIGAVQVNESIGPTLAVQGPARTVYY